MIGGRGIVLCQWLVHLGAVFWSGLLDWSVGLLGGEAVIVHEGFPVAGAVSGVVFVGEVFGC